MRRSRRIAVLVSGGVDSAILTVDYSQKGYNVLPLYVENGLRWERTELKHLRRFLKVVRNRRIAPLAILDINIASLYGRRHWSTGGARVPSANTPDSAVYLPGRNLILLSQAVAFAHQNRVHEIAMATLKGNPFSDAKPAFFSLFSRVASKALSKTIRVKTPYRYLSKLTLIQKFSDLPLHLTFSCIRPIRGMHCGRCNKCFERRKAFRKAKISDKTVYQYAA